MRVFTLVTGTYAAGVTNGSTVFFEPFGRTGTAVIQFGGATVGSGYMTLQGRMSSDLGWVNITTDTAGAIQIVTQMPQYRVTINNGTGSPTTFNAVIGA